MPDTTTVVNLTMTGSEVSYELPANVASAFFRARGGDVEFRSVSGSTPYITIDDGTHLTLTGRTVSEKIFYFDGASNVVVEVMLWLGSADPR